MYLYSLAALFIIDAFNQSILQLAEYFLTCSTEASSTTYFTVRLIQLFQLQFSGIHDLAYWTLVTPLLIQ